jgi:putative ABC transport system substrate-binding protein
MHKKLSYFPFATLIVMACSLANAQQPKIPRIGVITAGGAWYATIDGLRDGLRQLGLYEGKQLILEIRDTNGVVKAAEEAAKSLENEGVSLIYTTQTSISIAAKKATTHIPIVFCAGQIRYLSGWWRAGQNQEEDSLAFTSRVRTSPQNAWKI